MADLGEGPGGGAAPLILGKKEEMTEGKKASGAKALQKQSQKHHNLAFHHQMALRTPFLCNFQHFLVSINSFYGNKDYKLAGNFKLLATKLFTSETSVTMDTFRRSQVERIEILVRRGLISLQFHLSL